MITKVPVLKFYDVHDETTIQCDDETTIQCDDEATIQCDASEKGLGATLLQQGQPVAFVSRLLKTELCTNRKRVSLHCVCV